MGTADNGHYYSLIRVDNENWFEFNDIQVTNYNVANLQQDTFGFHKEDYLKSSIRNTKNAYVLFY